MIRTFTSFSTAYLVACLIACSTLTPEERSATIPNIPVEKKDCMSPLGIIPDGDSARGFLNEFESPGHTCQAGDLVCHDGVWTGAFVHERCTPGASVAP